MLYFEQLLIAKVIYDVINHMNKYLMTYVNYDVIYDVSVSFFLAPPVIYKGSSSEILDYQTLNVNPDTEYNICTSIQRI